MSALFDIAEPETRKSNEWYTPSLYVDAARAVMGGINLDPASCEMANRLVNAPHYYTEEQNGLAMPWYGKVWLNPPYGRNGRAGNIGLFTKKLLDEYQSGQVEQAVLLSTPRPDTPWFPYLWDYPICFVEKAIAFYWPVHGRLIVDTKHTGHFFGTIFVYLGPNEQKFVDVFQQFGTVARRISPAKEQPRYPSLWEGA